MIRASLNAHAFEEDNKEMLQTSPALFFASHIVLDVVAKHVVPWHLLEGSPSGH